MTNTSREAVVACARSWVGTPYHPHARVKGAGVDCAQLLIAVFSETGLLQEFDPGTYPTQWHLHADEELLKEWVEQFAVSIAEEDARPGDVVIYKFGRTFSHAGVVISWPTIVHAWQKSRLVIEDDGTAGYCDGRPRLFYRLKGMP